MIIVALVLATQPGSGEISEPRRVLVRSGVPFTGAAAAAPALSTALAASIGIPAASATFTAVSHDHHLLSMVRSMASSAGVGLERIPVTVAGDDLIRAEPPRFARGGGEDIALGITGNGVSGLESFGGRAVLVVFVVPSEEGLPECFRWHRIGFG